MKTDCQRPVVQLLSVLLALIALCPFQSYSQITVLESEPANKVDQFIRLAQKIEDGGLSLTDEVSTLIDMVLSFNDAKQIHLIDNTMLFKPQFNVAIARLLECDETLLPYLINPNPSIQDMVLLDRYAHALYLTARYVSEFMPKEEHVDFYAESRELYQKLANLTEDPAKIQDIALLDLGAQSRLWLAIYPLVTGPLDQESLNENLESLNAYLAVLNIMGVQSPQIENAVWISKLVECEIKYALKDYQGCIDCVDLHFGNTLEQLNDNTEDTIKVQAALDVLVFKIRSLKKMVEEMLLPDSIQPSIEFLDLCKEKSSEIIDLAEFLCSFKDSFALPESQFDVWNVRVRLLGSCYDELGMKDKMRKLYHDVYEIDNVRFQHLLAFHMFYELQNTDHSERGAK